MVGLRGFEPPPLAGHGPKPCASANSATSPCTKVYHFPRPKKAAMSCNPTPASRRYKPNQRQRDSRLLSDGRNGSVTVASRIESGIREYNQKLKANFGTIAHDELLFRSAASKPPKNAPSGRMVCSHRTSRATTSSDNFFHLGFGASISSDVGIRNTKIRCQRASC